MGNKIVFFIVLFASCTHMGKEKYLVQRDIAYSDKNNLKGDLYISKNPNADLVVTVHGGGWSSRSKSDMDHVAKSLASNGFHVFNINYRLSPEHRHPAPIVDLAEAIEFIDSHKQKFELNYTKVNLWGYSSGGHTVTMYSMKWPEKINKVVTGGAPYDLTWYDKSPYIFKYLGGYRDELFDEYRNASPVYKISSHSPSFFLYHGKSDNLVEYVQARNFESHLIEKGVSVKVHPVSFWGHINTFLFSKTSLKKGVGFLKQQE